MRGDKARSTLADAVPQLTPGQVETVLARLREANYGGTDPLVRALIDRMGETAGVRRRNRVAKWFTDASGRDERRADRQARGTAAEQRAKFADYREQLELRL